MSTRLQTLVAATIGVTIALTVAIAEWPAARLASTWQVMAIALVTSLAGAAIVAWLFSRRCATQVRAITRTAERYASGDFARPKFDYGSDDVGRVARAFDLSTQTLGTQIGELARDRARMEAVLSSMIEGVLALDRQGRVQLVNVAAQSMLHVPVSAL